jgi:hypothetical protein
MGGSISTKDRVLGVGAAFSALYCVAVSFMPSQPAAGERFFISLAIFSLCFTFVKQKKGVALGVIAFVVLRIVWGLVASLVQRKLG